jgi:prevent-host-death family protein
VKSKVGIAELKAHLSEYVRAAQKGKEIVIRDRTTEVARLVPRAAARFRTIRAKGSLQELDDLPGIRVDEGITPGYLDELTRELRTDYYDKWIASKQPT